MTSRSTSGRAFWPAALVLAAALSPAAAGAAEPPAADPPQAAVTAVQRTVVVGQAKLTWHLQPAAAVQRPALLEAFRQATAARLTGGEPYVTPKREPVVLPGGQLQLALPAEMIHTMLVDADGRTYCADSTVTAKAAAASAEEER